MTTLTSSPARSAIISERLVQIGKHATDIHSRVAAIAADLCGPTDAVENPPQESPEAPAGLFGDWLEHLQDIERTIDYIKDGLVHIEGELSNTENPKGTK